MTESYLKVNIISLYHLVVSNDKEQENNKIRSLSLSNYFIEKIFLFDKNVFIGKISPMKAKLRRSHTRSL